MDITEKLDARMPDFCTGSHGFHHTVGSALRTLSDLGVSPPRITVRMAGRGSPSGWIVGQLPRASEVLSPGVNVALSVAGLGFFHGLPLGMRDRGNEGGGRTQEIAELFDDPIQKTAHWIREGGKLFDIHPDNPEACSKWIALFGLDAENWPTDRWYNLAVLLPSLQSLAGREEGIGLALDLLLDLPLAEIRRGCRFGRLERDVISTLGRNSSRLGVDYILGDRLEDMAELTLVVGPVPLDSYYEFHSEESMRRLDAALGLCVPCHQPYRVSWVVLDPEKAPLLGRAKDNSILGINSHLGAPQLVGVSQ
jgi:hypothetical protein